MPILRPIRSSSRFSEASADSEEAGEEVTKEDGAGEEVGDGAVVKEDHHDSAKKNPVSLTNEMQSDFNWRASQFSDKSKQM